MGNKGSVQAHSPGQELTFKLLSLSGGGRRTADEVTLGGVLAYMQDYDPERWKWGAGMSASEKLIARYRRVEDLTEQIGMSGNRRIELLRAAYDRFNNASSLADAGILKPGLAQAASGLPAREREAASSRNHSPEVLRIMERLIADPHSVLNIGGRSREQLMALPETVLENLVRTDAAFVERTQGLWDPSLSGLSAALSYMDRNYRNGVVAQLTGVGGTNAEPTAALERGRRLADIAVRRGFKIDADAGNDRAIQLFAQTALAVDLAMASGNTLAGRGASTLTESTMNSPDGHGDLGAQMARYRS
ncbi:MULTISPECIES: hypothetical protein [unclassified Lysobacter]|uniref:hypothetical protein n=1 Tax=unclassified Lysobacter TaxID=2635362 RepID=UPI001BE5E20A|nr:MULTISPECIES: hypothetical protein [unclassified Lysobacter]MBT2746837.1 hypothetical protein [Lysobacter sp. ISL-42]MBT2750678.1 hypothetical protein [Lysobacter sp. ISL-50]MBT2779507.1 hypothetical protein [Lysobacter sp. ISL-54]MBT2784651.1 hypothetical protein [Lysobacter sp. ISL-52]